MNGSGGDESMKEKNYSVIFKTREMKSIYARFIKRTFFLILIIHFSTLSYATTYYVSNTGNDSNSGLTIDLSWKTLTKVNAATFASGDQILFKRGDTFFGSLTVQRSSISYGAYGTGANPIISGFETITGWVDQGNGIYRAATTASASCNMVTVNGVNTPMGRYPKTGWLTYESYSGRTSITDNQLTNTPNWTGAELVMKVNNWTIDRSLITNHTNGTLNYTAGSPSNSIETSAGYGYFFQKDLKTLTTLGDWYCDGTYIYMYFGANNPSSYVVKVAVTTNGITINSKNAVTVSNLTIEGANRYGIYCYLSAAINITNCTTRLGGYTGIFGVSNNGITLDGCSSINNNGSGVDITSTSATVRNSIIDNNGKTPGMGGTDGIGYTALTVRSTGGLIEYNKVSNSGYNGINYYNDSFIVRYNEVYNTNNLITDGAGIYTFVGDPSIIRAGQKVYNNIVHDCGANGLYFDNSANNMDIYNNTILNVGKNGFHINDGFNLSIHGNTFYNCTVGAMSFQNTYLANGYCHDNSIYSNNVVQKAKTQLLTNLRDLHTDNIINLGTSNNNKFVIQSLSDALFSRMKVQPYYDLTKYTYSEWTAYSGQEVNSTMIPGNVSDVYCYYNPTNSDSIIKLPYSSVDLYGTKYGGSNLSQVLAPYTSIVLIKDSISPIYYTEYKSICDGTNYYGWTVAGKYERTLTSKSGGDSIVTTLLTINPTYSLTEDVTINQGETYNGWTKTGKYSRTLSSVSGCDSIIVTNLTVDSLIIKQGSIAPTHFIPVWQGENGINHMNVMVVSATLEDLSLSPNDEIALFSGSKCVGSMTLTQAINPADNSTFLTIPASQDDGSNNGFTENDTILIKIWDSVNQREMIARKVNYRNDISTWLTTGRYSAGATSVIEIASYAEYSQTINLLKGYNLISTYVTADNPNVVAVTKPLCDQGSLIKVQDETGTSFENWGSFGGWVNNLGSLDIKEGYKIKVANNCTLQVTGRPIALPLDIPLNTGWNIISFPRMDLVDAMNVIQPLIDQNKLIKVQDELGNSIENWGLFGGWVNGIGNFMPGKAYKVKMSGNAILTIQENYTKSAVILATTESTIHFSTGFEGNGTDQMNINLVGLQEAGFSSGDEVAAYDNDVCVGTLKLTEANLNNGTASLIASSSADGQLSDGFKSGDIIQLKFWNQLSGNEEKVQAETLNGQLNYEKNGSVWAKIKSSATNTQDRFVDMMKIDVFPNPCKGKVTVRFSTLPDTGSRIDILDIEGRKVTSRFIDDTSEEFNLGDQPAGIYLVKTVVGIAETIHKLVINR